MTDNFSTNDQPKAPDGGQKPSTTQTVYQKRDLKLLNTIASMPGLLLLLNVTESIAMYA